MGIKERLKYSLIGDFFRSIKSDRLKRAWRRRNNFNDAHAMNCFNLDNVSVGKYSYGLL